MLDSQWAVSAEGLVKKFGSFRAVDGIDLHVPTGSVYGILGPNGAGKTTVIRMLATLLGIDGGTAKIFGYDVMKEQNIVRQLIGLTGQYASVDKNLTGKENLMIYCRLLGLSSKESKKRTDDLLEAFGLTEAANKSLEKFSGGMRRRLDLAASMIAQPPLLFLDEPTTGLDPNTRTQMWDTIHELVKTGSTILLTTQYLDEADQLADKIAVIDRGQVVGKGTPNELKDSVGSSSLQLTLDNVDQIPQAIEIVETRLHETPVLSPESHRITVPLQDTGVVGSILVELERANLSVAEVGVQKPTLDDVFFALTGHGAEDESGDSSNKEKNSKNSEEAA